MLHTAPRGNVQLRAAARPLKGLRSANLGKRGCVVARAEPEKKNDGKSEDVEKAIQAMKNDGINDKVARKVMELWEQQDVKDAKGLRNQLVSGGLSLVALTALQLGIDIIASESAGAAAFAAGVSQYWGHNAVSILFLTLRYYFLLSAAFDVFRVGSLIGVTIQTGRSANTLYSAIEELAGQKTGIAIVDKAQAAVSTARVLKALNSIRTSISGDLSGFTGSSSTLGGLTSYFVLQHAAQTYGSEAIDKHGLSEDELSRCAGTFGRFDRNQDYRLEFSEFKQVCSSGDFDLSDEEVKAAMTLLDKRGSGYIEFDEFVAWWADNVDLPASKSQDTIQVEVGDAAKKTAEAATK